MVHLRFDRGTILLLDLPREPDLSDLPGVLWDCRVGAWRAPAMHHEAILAELPRRGVRFADQSARPADPSARWTEPGLRPYQDDALWAWHRAGQRGLVVLPTGSGKTRVAIAAMARPRVPRLALVPTRVLLDQWIKELSANCSGPVGCLGDGQRRVESVTVATFESGWRQMDRIGDRFRLVVVDEVHHFGDGRRDEALEPCAAPLRLGLTATPPRTPSAEQLLEHLRESLVGVPDDTQRLVAHVLLGLARSRVASAVPPREARALVFAAAARGPGRPADSVLAGCAEEMRMAPEALRDALFADLPGERLALPPASLDPSELALRANLLLAQALVARAARVEITLEGNARAVVRYALLRGLICTVVAGSAPDGARVELSGPFALFRRTLLYGRAAPGWAIVREPEPIQAGGHLVFPDFAVHPRTEPEHRWLVEIVGFWTPEYLAATLQRLRDARIANLVLCIDATRNVGLGDLTVAARVIRYRRRVDPISVLAVIEGSCGR